MLALIAIGVIKMVDCAFRSVDSDRSNYILIDRMCFRVVESIFRPVEYTFRVIEYAFRVVESVHRVVDCLYNMLLRCYLSAVLCASELLPSKVIGIGDNVCLVWGRWCGMGVGMGDGVV